MLSKESWPTEPGFSGQNKQLGLKAIMGEKI